MTTMTTALPILGAAFRIPKDLLEDWEMDEIRRDLTFIQRSSRQFGGAGNKWFLAYDDSGDWMEVPRHYGISAMRRFTHLRGLSYVDRAADGSPADFTFDEERQKQKPNLKKAQDRIVETVMGKLGIGWLGGAVVAPCGTGKTVLALKLMSKINRTTLIMVHKAFLVSQWMDRIEEFLGIPRSEIGVVQQDRCDYEGRRIVIGMVQSLVEREYAPGLYAYPGLVLADELHRHAAAQWHKAVMRFSSRYRVGLTATPDRGDGLWKVITENFGDILAQEEGEAMSPTIYVVKYTPAIPLQKYCWIQERCGMFRVKKAYLARLLNVLADHNGRNEMLVGVIRKAVDEGRKVLVLTDRRSHITKMMNWLNTDFDGRVTVGRYVGGMSDAALSISEKCQVILGTFQMAMEALDIPDLDVGVLATPHANVEQPIGRICRHMDGKKQPIIIDVADDEPYLCQRFFQKRLRLYQSKGWTVRFV